MKFPVWSSDEGSLPAALLAVLVVAGLVTVLTASVITGQRATGFDQNFEQALYRAEEGLNRLVSRIETDPNQASPLTAASADYAANASRNASGIWTITSTGTAPNGTTRRTVQAEVRRSSMFNVAAFGKVSFTMLGNNSADSYCSGVYSTTYPRTFTPNSYSTYLDASNNVIPNSCSGAGVVATNGVLRMNGQDFANADGAEIHNARRPPWLPAATAFDERAGATGYCDGVPATCNGYLTGNTSPPTATGGKLRYHSRPIDMPAVQLPATPSGHFDGRNGGVLAPGVHVFTSARLDTTTVIQGTPTNPTILYLTGQLSIPNHAKVNFVNSGGILRPRPSPSFIIRSASEGVAMQFGNHVAIAAAIYAPTGAFGGGAAGDIYGSLVSNSAGSNGSWRFHYDQALANMDDVGHPSAQNWVEIQNP